MAHFEPSELDEIDRLWRALGRDHMWSGWAAAGDQPEQVWIYRTRAHWRRFPLTKGKRGYALADERGQKIAVGRTLADLLKAIEGIPGLETYSYD